MTGVQSSLNNNDKHLKSLHKSKSGYMLIGTGVIIVLSSMVLSAVKFGVTFGTIFLGAVGILLILWGFFNKLKKIERYKGVANIFQKILNVLFVIWLTSFFIIQGLIFSAAVSSENVKVDYVVVLGAGLRGEEPSVILTKRLIKSLDYLEKNPDIKVIVSGGQGPGETITEAEAMSRYLVKNGIAEQRIFKEEKSTSTKENILYTKEILTKIGNGEKQEIAIITSEFHLFRAKFLAQRNGLEPQGIPAKTPTYVLVNYLIREYFAIVKSFIFDY